jgi:NADPH:quinone reductase-like Zn-dependent oxidoreductase
MEGLTAERYGPPGVVRVSRLPVPAVGPDEVLVNVHASAVNTADWRIRAAAFPGILSIPGRLMFGLLRPRNPRLGSEFAGSVVETGASVTRFCPGDRVYGIVPTGGASAQYLSVSQGGAIARIPDSLDFPQAAALPFGALCALVFLSRYADLSPTRRLLVVGASGGVGTYAVQVGKALGAHVTGVAGPDSQAFIAQLGADVTLDYRASPPSVWPSGFDVVFDTFGALRPAEAWRLLAEGGLYLPLNFGLREIVAALLNPLRNRKIKLAVNEDTAEGMSELTTLVEQGRLKPVVEHAFRLRDAAKAHALVETRHRHGSVILLLDRGPLA